MIKIVFVLAAVFASTLLHGGHVIVMRHGRALSNDLGIFNCNPNNPGYRPMPLTDVGRQQARTAGTTLKEELTQSGRTLARVFYSPLPRTEETAQIVAGILGVPTERRINTALVIENDVGKFEGRKYSEFPYDPWDMSHNHEPAIQGETLEDVQLRIRRFLTLSVQPEFANAPSSTTVLVVTHGGPGAVLLQELGQDPEALDNAEYRDIEFEFPQ